MRSVLVVEDEPLIRFDAVMLLEEAGFPVVEFDSARAAAVYLEEHGSEVAALFTDINLRGDMDGLELARLVAARLPSVFVVVTSGRFIRTPDGLPEGVRFLKKPWLPLDLIAALQSAL